MIYSASYFNLGEGLRALFGGLSPQKPPRGDGTGSAGKFYFLSLLVNQLAPWIRCVFHGKNKVYRANEAPKQLGFTFLSYLNQGARSLSVFLQLRQIFNR